MEEFSDIIFTYLFCRGKWRLLQWPSTEFMSTKNEKYSQEISFKFPLDSVILHRHQWITVQREFGVQSLNPRLVFGGTPTSVRVVVTSSSILPRSCSHSPSTGFVLTDRRCLHCFCEAADRAESCPVVTPGHHCS